MLAAGSGARFGGDKVLLHLGAERVIDRSLAAARSACDGVVAVVPPEWSEPLEADVVVTGGATRSESVRAGLAHVPVECDVVVIHDAARPLATPALFKAVIAPLADPQIAGAIPGLPVTDTIKRLARADVGLEAIPFRVAGTVPREGLRAVQTPQAFRAADLRAAHAKGADATDDAALIEAAGGTVVIVPGERTNMKLTHSEDLILLQALAEGPRS